MSPEQRSNKTSYPIDPESGAEMARLMFQERMLNENMGGTLSEQDPNFVKKLKNVLDLGCGPGGWILNLAYENPDTHIVGVDISKSMTDYARAQAWSQGLNNTEFKPANILEPLPFEDQSFDLVNARYIESFVSKTAWPQLIKECVRITRPGGVIRITEGENYGMTNSPAYQKLTNLGLQGQYQLGNTFSIDGHSTGLIPMLGKLLLQGGCSEVHRQAHILDFSTGRPEHDTFIQNMLVAAQLGGGFLVRLGLISEEERAKELTNMHIQMMQDDFCGVLIYVTTWGRVPAKT